MKKNHKTVFKWVCGILAVCPVILAACTWYLFGSFITAANSIEKLEDGLYAMEYNGDYGFDEFLDGGGAADDTDVRDMLESVAQKNYPQTEGSYEKPCGALFISRWGGTPISTLRKILNTAMD